MNLQEKHDLYVRLIPMVQDVDGFVMTDGCDSLLFSALIGCVPGVKFDPYAAFDLETYQWYRRPRQYPECLECGGAASTISRDMLLGLLWWAWAHRHREIPARLVDYAKQHYGIMGQGERSRTFISGLIGTAAQLEYQLGGRNHRVLRRIPLLDIPGTTTDYQAHLSVLHTLLRERMGCTTSTRAQTIYQPQRLRQPKNPLFLYASGRDAEAEMELMNPHVWPEDRLPTTENYHDPWPIQRDAGQDWSPSVPRQQRTGGDFLFVSALLLDLLG